MTTFEIVTVAVSVGSAGAGLVAMLRASGGPLDQLGRTGGTWFSHSDDLPLSERPSEDERDAPLPHRVLRGRPD